MLAPAPLLSFSLNQVKTLRSKIAPGFEIKTLQKGGHDDTEQTHNSALRDQSSRRSGRNGQRARCCGCLIKAAGISAGAGGGGGARGGGKDFDGRISLQGHRPGGSFGGSLGGKNHGRVRPGGGFDAAAAKDEASLGRGAVNGDRHACSGIAFKGDGLRVADGRGCGHLDLAVADLRDGLQAGCDGCCELRCGFP